MPAMNYGFLIRNDRCIGCHACSTACKSENDVPVGVNRTWVKNVEKGRFPDVRRTFQVTRCNHCANPPCVRICPVTAMYQREDGIVEFDGERCIGCKACLQACPYDAIYIDPDTGTAAKCHFCAHRVEMALEPACVVVCPEHAIISGDLDDPASEISRMLAAHDTTVRKPEQGTAPKLFYVDGDEVALHPAAVERAPVSFAYADVVPLHGPGGHREGFLGGGRGNPRRGRRGGRRGGRAPSGTPIRVPGEQGVPAGGPIHIGAGRMAGEIVRPFYNAQHRVPWHWPVPAYLVTKGIGAGALLVLALLRLLAPVPVEGRTLVAGGLVSLVFTGLTTGLLVWDLERPERFLRVLTRPQWTSWLTRGAWLLVAFTLLVGWWWIAELGGLVGWWGPEPARAALPWGLGVGSVLAMGVATYTAFLFGQAEGRDLWQSPLLPVHLLVQAVVAGAAALLWLQPFVGARPEVEWGFRGVLLFALMADILLILLAELGMPHASGDAARAAHEIRHGRYAVSFWGGVVVAGHLVPSLLVLGPGAVPPSLAGLFTLVGLYLYERAFVMAPQEIPNS